MPVKKIEKNILDNNIEEPFNFDVTVYTETILSGILLHLNENMPNLPDYKMFNHEWIDTQKKSSIMLVQKLN